MPRDRSGQFVAGQFDHDITDQRFGRLTAISPAVGKGRTPMWNCRCDCGREVVVSLYGLRRGTTQSCTCLRKERTALALTTHGLAHTPEYHIWLNMRKRCYDAKCRHYHRYGGRGIRVCPRWLDSFEAFYEDVGPRPTEDHSLDRFPDQNGNYETGNVRWATPSEQTRNKRNNVLITYQGQTRILTDWAKELGIHRRTLKDRLDSGMSMEEAVSRPIGTVKRTMQYEECCGVLANVAQWARILEVPDHTIRRRINAGRPAEEVIRDILRRKREDLGHILHS